jgi:hypothetical protein
MTDDSPLFPLKILNSRIVVHGPDNEELTLDDPRCENVGIRTCSQCRAVKLLSEFWENQGNWCKQCHAEYARERYAAGGDEAREANTDKHQQWSSRNREHLNAYQREHREKNPEMYRESRLRSSFHMTGAEYDAILQTQGGGCAICGQPCGTGRNLGVDHDHSCCPKKGKSCGKCNRGLLCVDCNSGLGWFHDDPARLLAAAAYLSEHAARLRA